jgi:hypothetical protein
LFVAAKPGGLRTLALSIYNLLILFGTADAVAMPAGGGMGAEMLPRESHGAAAMKEEQIKCSD